MVLSTMSWTLSLTMSSIKPAISSFFGGTGPPNAPVFIGLGLGLGFGLSLGVLVGGQVPLQVLGGGAEDSSTILVAWAGTPVSTIVAQSSKAPVSLAVTDKSLL